MTLRPEILKLQRRGWTPVVASGDGDVTASKFSGVPALLPGESWPACGHCGRRMQLFLQLNLATLPAELSGRFGDGLLQLFYCVGEEPQCEVEANAWEPFSKSVLARRVATPPKVDRSALPPKQFPPRRIVSWTAVEDLPNWEELESLGFTLSAAEERELERRDVPVGGDKLAGWPRWVQGLEYPTCTKCGKVMQLVFQVDSDRNLPFMFGDAGTGHLTQCPDHKDVLGFGWACG